MSGGPRDLGNQRELVPMRMGLGHGNAASIAVAVVHQDDEMGAAEGIDVAKFFHYFSPETPTIAQFEADSLRSSGRFRTSNCCAA